jgi:hypothetical protein
MMLIATLSTYVPGRAITQDGLTSGGVVNIAHFFKPPNMDAATAVNNFNTIVLTNGDHTYRDQLYANGFSGTIPEYLRADGIHDPGDCSSSPLNNQAAYKAGDFCWISYNHPDWFLLDRYGNRITVTSGGRYYRMDPASPGWREFFFARLIESQQTYGWRALFLDNVEASLSKFYGPLPVKYPDNQSYQNAVLGFLQYLDVNYSQAYDRPMFGNIVARDSDAVWFNYLQYLDGAMQERFAVDWNETSYLSITKWLNDLSLMERTQANGKYVILVAPGNQNDLNRESFAFASYLLISNGKAAFRYSTDDAYGSVWLYDNYKVNLGNPLGSRYAIGSVWRRDFDNGCVAVDPANQVGVILSRETSIASVFVNGQQMGGCYDARGKSQRVSFAGVDSGPVKVVSTNGVTPIVASERAIQYFQNSASYSEMMSYPANKLTTKYWFPWYNNVSYSTQLRVSNLGSNSAQVKIIAAGNEVDNFNVAAGETRRIAYNLDKGPLQVVSMDGLTPILASEQFIQTYQNSSSFAEMTGYPANQLTVAYWFPWYNNVSYSTQLRVSNMGSTSTQIRVFAGSTPVDTFTLDAGESKRISYPSLDSGPLYVASTDGVTPILASERFIQTYLNSASYSEMMGYPTSQLTTGYCFPWYNNTFEEAVAVSSQLRVSNMSRGSAQVKVYLGGSAIETFTLSAGAGRRVSYPGVNSGSLCVVSTDGATPILASERFISTYQNSSSYSEMIGYPMNQLTTTYWFPWYNNATGGLSSELRFGLP